MRRITTILCNILLIGLMAPMAVAEIPKCNWDETPAFCASTTWFDIFLERDLKLWEDWSEKDFVAFIDEHYIDGRVVTEDWFESSLLFEVSCNQAEDNWDDSEARARLLMIALKAAESALGGNPDSIMVSQAASKMDPIDEWFCSTILRLVKYPATEGKYPAIRQYNVYCLQDALGNQKAAREAIEDAYTMCPKDVIIRSSVRSIRTEMKDFSGAIEAIKDDDNKPTMDIWRISREATHAQRLGDIHLKAGELEKAHSKLLEAWDALDRLQKKKEELEFVGVPIVDMSRNRTATSLGLIALKKGDVEEARRWLKASLTHDMFMEYKGYDMRLVKDALPVAALKGECVNYLEAASILGTDKMKDEAFSMLRTLAPSIEKDDLPGISAEASVPKRIIKAATKCTDARKSLSIGNLDDAQRLLDTVWAECEKMVADDKNAKVAYREGIAYLRNQCATLLGLVAYERGDIEKAAQWLRASSVDAEKGHPPKRYDLELVEKLSWEPTLKADCVRYLELASKTDSDEARAKELLDKLKGAGI